MRKALFGMACGLIGGIMISMIALSPARTEAKSNFNITKVESNGHYNVFVIEDKETGNSYVGFSYLSIAHGKASVSITPRLDGQEYYHK